MASNSFEDKEQGTVSSDNTSGIQGDPNSVEGKASYGGTSLNNEEKQEKENQGFPTGSYNENSEGGENNIINEDAPSE